MEVYCLISYKKSSVGTRVAIEYVFVTRVLE